MAFEGEETGERRPRGAGRVARPGVRGAKAGGRGGGGAPAPRAFVIPNRQRFLTGDAHNAGSVYSRVFHRTDSAPRSSAVAPSNQRGMKITARGVRVASRGVRAEVGAVPGPRAPPRAEVGLRGLRPRERAMNGPRSFDFVLFLFRFVSYWLFAFLFIFNRFENF